MSLTPAAQATVIRDLWGVDQPMSTAMLFARPHHLVADMPKEHSTVLGYRQHPAPEQAPWEVIQVVAGEPQLRHAPPAPHVSGQNMRQISLATCRKACREFAAPHPHPLQGAGMPAGLIRGAILMHLLPMAAASTPAQSPC